MKAETIEFEIERHQGRIDSLRRAGPEFDSDVDYHNRKIAQLKNKLPKEEIEESWYI